MVELTSLTTWDGGPGTVVTWEPTAATRAAMAQAPRSSVPLSYQQEQHLRSYRSHTADGLEMARLLLLTWDIPGSCDLRAMTYVINAHLRRHDTYRSRFEFDSHDHAVRYHLDDPQALAVEPVNHGTMTTEQWRAHLVSAPSPLQWDCFRFGVIQRPDSATIYATIDHLHADALFIVVLFTELHRAYDALLNGEAPPRLPAAGSYLDFCGRQRQYTDALTLDSPEVRSWIRFLESNGGTMPHFPLSLGDPDVPCHGELVTVPLLDASATDRFEAACAAAGARMIGGMLACAALTERDLTGAHDYNVITPTTTRTTVADFSTTGWFTGVVPIHLTVADRSFGEIALEAQHCFDDGLPMAFVPIERMWELAEPLTHIHTPPPGVPMLSYLDSGMPPLSPEVVAEWSAHGGRLSLNDGAAKQIGLWVTRGASGTTLTVAYPDNDQARESVRRYTAQMRTIAAGVAEGVGA